MSVDSSSSQDFIVFHTYANHVMDQTLDPHEAAQFLVDRGLFNGIMIGPDHHKKVVYFSSIFKWYGKDFVARHLPSSGIAGLSATKRAVANFCSRYLAPSDSNYLQTGEYSVKYLDYDWSLNTR